MLTFVHRCAARMAARWCFQLQHPLKHLTATVHTSWTCTARSLPELTSVRYPNVTRGDFGCLSADDFEFFKKLLNNPGQVLTEDDDLISYNLDWMGSYRGSSSLVLRPKTTAEVSEILRYCNDRRLAVVPQGGNTGLVGGSTPVFDEVVVSTQLMNHVLSFDKLAGILTCQSGCVLQQLDDDVLKDGFMMPLDLGAKGSCHIGGNVSTNAGGMRLLRYGSLHGNILGLEAVLANGEVIDCLSGMRKDNTGYHLKHLFIGAEGTLGIVTAVTVLCPRRPASVNVAFFGCESFEAVLELLSSARASLNEILSAFEFIDAEAMSSVTAHLRISNPISSSSSFYVLLETSGSNAAHDEAKLQMFIDTVTSSGLVTDGTIATVPSKIKALWRLREEITAGLLDDGFCYKYDISLPLDDYYKVVEVMRHRLRDVTTRVVAYGHVGDGNLHFNATSPEYSREVVGLIEPFLYEYVSQRRGSISAEHGIGFSKRKYMHYSRNAPAIELMRRMKQALDPRGILNPYKTIPAVASN